MHLTILSSGSEGNVVLVESGSDRVYIDAGLRSRELSRRLRAAFPRDHEARRPTAAFLTHEHGDHIDGAGDLLAQGLVLYGTCGTIRALDRAAGISAAARTQVRELAAGEPVQHGAFMVHPVALPHDAAEPVGYVIADGRVRLGVLTDCGHPAREVVAGFAGCDALVLETNHDIKKLLQGPYPPSLKRRIAANSGHLSNDQSAQLLQAIQRASPPGPRLVICAHLSKTNNHPDLARAALSRVLGSRPAELLVASQQEPLGPLDLESLAGRRGQMEMPWRWSTSLATVK